MNSLSLQPPRSSATSAVNPPAVKVEGERMAVQFDRFDLSAYEMFLKVKRLPEYEVEFLKDSEGYRIKAPARFAEMLGVARPSTSAGALSIWPKLYDDQQAIVKMALDAKRFACWSDCGLGKTFIGGEFARQVGHETGGRILIITLNEIVPQWVEMIGDFYGGELALTRLDSRQHMKEWCATGAVDGKATPGRVAITNYEKLNHGEKDQVVSEMHGLAGVIADESDRLATGGGKQKWALIKSSKGVPFKLSLTATPAPNETMEFASQASFLETMRSGNEIIWTFFRRDEKTQKWTVKRHARQAFFEFLAGWSIYVRDPRRYGWRKDAPVVPEPDIFEHQLHMTAAQAELLAGYHRDDDGQNALFRMSGLNTIQRGKLSQIAKGFVYRKGESARQTQPVASNKPTFTADLIAQEMAGGLQVLCWTVFDAESEILCEELGRRGLTRGKDFELLTGRTGDKERLAILERFRHGQVPSLVSRASMLGYGMNFQHTGSMVFSGFTDSYKHFYQALRRAWRPGQTKKLRVHIPYIHELEGDCWDNILRKSDQHEAAIAEMEAHYIKALGSLRGNEEQRGKVTTC